ncbi:MAG: hypothetical protein QNJ55_36510 [Xenococcus sp. MO_188.B8]|nr:hypothetical protein [Xenococcus sp. MO_188.B8]
MANITRIDARVLTGTKSGAGTDGRVYIAVGGREFRLDSSIDDFEAGSDRTYILGAGSNVNNAAFNDPRNPQLDSDDLDEFPVYIRFEPTGDNADWNVEQLFVTVNPGPTEIRFGNPMLNGGPDLWLGQSRGEFIYLTRS